MTEALMAATNAATETAYARGMESNASTLTGQGVGNPGARGEAKKPRTAGPPARSVSVGHRYIIRPALLSSRRTYFLVALTVLVVVFVSFHPYFDAEGLCGSGGCPKPSHSSHATHSISFSTVCLAAVLVTSDAAALTFASFFKRLRAANHRRPSETYLSPDAPPPQILSSH